MRGFAGIILIFAIFLVGCGDDGTSSDTSDEGIDTPSFAQHIQPILTANCANASCHGGSSPAMGYSLTSHAGALGAGSDATPNVVPEMSSESLLYRRAENGSMPPGATRLEAKDVTTIKNWIDQGAQDN